MDALGVLNNMAERIVNDPVTFILLVLVALLIVGHAFLIARLKRFMRGANGKSMESFVRALDERTTKLETEAKSLGASLKNVDVRVQNAVRAVPLKRFDPFGARQGEQSFSAAFLSEKGDGVVISGIHSRDGVRVYAKEVANYASERELSEEERAAIQEAKK